ncbi:MAG: hypothetical protein [Caudovirales sp. ctOwN3]|nr:MAG: hypothetical protein [Caudovirales sp. ctOwN3]
MTNPQLFIDVGWDDARIDIIGQNGNTGIHYALLDDEGEVVRFFDHPAEGTVKWPPDPEWDNPPF